MSSVEKTRELSKEELRELIPELQELTDKYKRAEKIQTALFEISELASSASNLERLYKAIHKIISNFLVADNFYVAFYDRKDQRVDFVYFVDQEINEEEVNSVPFDKVIRGVTGHILTTGNNLVITQENKDKVLTENKIEVLGKLPVDLIGMPLKRSEDIIGAMVVQSYDERERYNNDDVEVLSFISQHIVTTVDRVKSRETTERTIRDRTRQLRAINNDLQEEINERQKVEKLQQALFEISELSATADEKLDSFYQKLHEILARLISAPNCFVSVLTKEKDALEFPYYSDLKNKYVERRPIGNELTEYIIRNGEAALVNAEKANLLAEKSEISDDVANRMSELSNSWLGAPLIIDGEVIGVIAVQTYGKGRDYTFKDLEILRYVSHHIAVAIERRTAADALKEYNLQLADKVRDRTNELNKTNEYLKKQIEQRKEIELKLFHDAHHDSLTDLPNRAMFMTRLELALANKKRHPENQFAVLFIDLDRFKLINDTLGHHAGDEFLIEVSKRIGMCKRGHDLLARLGGDEFVVLVDSFNDTHAIEDVAERIITAVSEPFILEGKEMFSGASIGIAHLTNAYLNADEVLRDADSAMYQAKSQGRGRYITFNSSMREKLLDNMKLESAFRQALKDEAFDCVLRPIVDLVTNETLYYDCAIQWHHTRFGDIDNNQFWNLVERCGLTVRLNEYLLNGVCKLLGEWADDPLMNNKHISVSLSAEHLMQTSLIGKLIDQVIVSGFEANKLLLAFSESALSNRAQFIMPSLKKLKRHGFGLVLDNFGTGNASLNYIFSYPYDFIKIEHRFVNSIARSKKSFRFVESIILVSERSGLSVIADGVDNDQKLEMLREMGCDFGVGSHLGETLNIKFEKSFDN